MSIGSSSRERVIIFGSREYTNERLVGLVLTTARDRYGRILVVHGDCPTGADHHAREWVEAQLRRGSTRATQDPHPAGWERCGPECPPGHLTHRGGKTYCRSAGFRRNAVIARLGAAEAHGFWQPGARNTGTEMMHDLLTTAGINVIPHGRPDTAPAEHPAGLW